MLIPKARLMRRFFKSSGEVIAGFCWNQCFVSAFRVDERIKFTFQNMKAPVCPLITLFRETLSKVWLPLYISDRQNERILL